MEGKLFGYLLVLVFVICGGAWMNHSMAVADLRSKLYDLRASVQTVQRTIEGRELQIEMQAKSKGNITDQTKADAALAERERALTRQLDDLKKRAEAHNIQTIELAGQLSAAVMTLRTAAIGQTMAELPLPKGTVLKQAQIKRISEDTIVVAHAFGSARLHRADVPPEWADKFQLIDPIITKPTTVKAGATVAIVPSESAAPSPPTPASPPPPARVTELRTKIAQLQAQIHIAKGNASAWNTRHSDLSASFSSAESKGRIVTNKDRLETARAMALSFSQQVTRMEAQLIEFQQELLSVNTGG